MSATLERVSQQEGRVPIIPENEGVARGLDQLATLLERQGANPFRVRAYRDAATTVRGLRRAVGEIVRTDGVEALDALPGIGPPLARAIAELATTGRQGMLDRLRGEHEPLALLASVPGIGTKSAARLHDELGIETLEELEAAASDGRLRYLPGFGDKRIAGVRDALATRLGRARRAAALPTSSLPSVAEILDVDREYRRRANAGTLPRIAPRRFNATGEAWLPVLHLTRGDRHYTALFSNTARAHQLGKTHDWVVIYYDGGGGERQCTVVTATHGPLKGRRVVRGREGEGEAAPSRIPVGA
jgi:Holliday junction resolvasome RuvABC DNA-binding subunit